MRCESIFFFNFLLFYYKMMSPIYSDFKIVTVIDLLFGFDNFMIYSTC